jgi:hypothetical protein
MPEAKGLQNMQTTILDTGEFILFPRDANKHLSRFPVNIGCVICSHGAFTVHLHFWNMRRFGNYTTIEHFTIAVFLEWQGKKEGSNR